MATTIGDMDTETVNRLNAHIKKIEDLEEERATTGELIKDEYAVAKAAGFDPKVMRIVLKMRRRDSDELTEEETMIELYKTALGMH